MLNDGANDILHLIDDVYQETVSEHDEIDIDSFEITTSHVYLTLHATLNTLEFRRYSIEIYWDDVVEDRGFNFYKNQTKCTLDFETNYFESKAWNSQNDSVASAHGTGGAIQNGNIITWPIETSMFADPLNPTTIFVKTIYSETLEIVFPTGVIEEWIDYYPDNSQTYSESAGYSFLGIITTSLIALIIIIRFRKK